MHDGKGPQPDEYEHPVYSARFVHHLWFPDPDRIMATADQETHSVALHLEDGFLYVLAAFEPEDVETLARQLEEYQVGVSEAEEGPLPAEGPPRLELRLFEADLTPGGDDEDTLSFTLGEAEDPDVVVVCHMRRAGYNRVVEELRRAAREVLKAR